MKRIIIAMSGGLDSTVLLGWAITLGYDDVVCINFQYGSKHNPYELKSFFNVINYYQRYGASIRHDVIQVPNLFIGPSGLLKGGDRLSSGSSSTEALKQSVVPGRNLIFASILASMAEAYGIGTVALGMQSGDHEVYPDCRPSFVHSLKETIEQGTDGAVEILAPFLNMDKKEIISLGVSQIPQVPYHLTRTCYRDQQIACGTCGSCLSRLKAFNDLGIKDPITYE